MNNLETISDYYFDVCSLNDYKLVVYQDYLVFGQGKVNHCGKLTFPPKTGFVFKKNDALDLLQFLLNLFVFLSEPTENCFLKQNIGSFALVYDKSNQELIFQETIRIVGNNILDFAKAYKILLFKIFGYPMHINFAVWQFLKEEHCDSYYSIATLKEKILFLEKNVFGCEENCCYYLCEILDRHTDVLKKLNTLRFL
jgi:hypothetical protein